MSHYIQQHKAVPLCNQVVWSLEAKKEKALHSSVHSTTWSTTKIYVIIFHYGFCRKEEYALQAVSVQSFWRMDRWQAEGMEGTEPLSTDFRQV
jgi:hypothetical protein